MFPVKYDQRQHEILETEVARWCRRNAPADWRDRLFTYHHQVHDTFVVAVWASDEKMGILSDVLNLGNSLGNFDHKKADEMMKRMWCPLTPQSMARQIRQADRDYCSIQQDRGEEVKEYMGRRQHGKESD